MAFQISCNEISTKKGVYRLGKCSDGPFKDQKNKKSSKIVGDDKMYQQGRVGTK